MKKSLLLSLILLSGVLLTACGKNEEQNVEEDVQPVENSVEVSVEDQQPTEVVYDCATTIQRYLDGSDKNGQ
jgi:predicted small secreted protein